VPTRAAVLTRISHVYALNALIDPNTIRYASVTTDRALTLPNETRSPTALPTTSRSTPPVSICTAEYIPDDTRGAAPRA